MWTTSVQEPSVSALVFIIIIIIIIIIKIYCFRLFPNLRAKHCNDTTLPAGNKFTTLVCITTLNWEIYATNVIITDLIIVSKYNCQI